MDTIEDLRNSFEILEPFDLSIQHAPVDFPNDAEFKARFPHGLGLTLRPREEDPEIVRQDIAALLTKYQRLVKHVGVLIIKGAPPQIERQKVFSYESATPVRDEEDLFFETFHKDKYDEKHKYIYGFGPTDVTQNGLYSREIFKAHHSHWHRLSFMRLVMTGNKRRTSGTEFAWDQDVLSITQSYFEEASWYEWEWKEEVERNLASFEEKLREAPEELLTSIAPDITHAAIPTIIKRARANDYLDKVGLCSRKVMQLFNRQGILRAVRMTYDRLGDEVAWDGTDLVHHRVFPNDLERDSDICIGDAPRRVWTPGSHLERSFFSFVDRC